MKSWKLFPNIESVSKYVECYWFLEKEPHDLSNNYPKLNPDPSAHLIITNNTHTSHYTHNTISQTVKGNHWIFPHINTLAMDHSAAFKIIGIKFKPGALYSLYGRDSCSILDKVELADLNRLFGTESIYTDELLVSAIEKKDQLGNTLDESLSSWVLNAYEDKHSILARKILRLLSDTPISEIGAKLHRSQRTIERSFVRVTGLSMKQVNSMNRLEEILNHLYLLDNKDINWADVARKYDFSDQPHFIHHLKNAIGRTPAEYVQRRDLTIDTYGDFNIN